MKYNPVFWAALLSFALSLGIYSHLDVINRDGVLYLSAAREFTRHHFTEGLALYPWPFYSGMIAGLSALTRLTVENSAFLLNAGLMGLLAGGFINLIRTLGGTRTIQWLAVLIFMIHTGLNDYREYVIRDFGCWAFLIWSLVFLCKIHSQARWSSILGWTLCAGSMLLFRPESIIWLTLGPLALLYSCQDLSFKSRLVRVIQTQSLFIGFGLISLIAILVLGIKLPANKLHELSGAIFYFFNSGFQAYELKAEGLSALMSEHFKTDHALVVLGFALVFYGSYLLLKLFSPLYSILLGYGIYRRPLIRSEAAWILIWALMIYTSMFLGFLFQSYFISSRYMIPWVLIAMVWVPFSLYALWPRLTQPLKILLGLVLAFMCFKGVIHFGYSKAYLKDAGLWIAQNTPSETLVYSPSTQVAFYADRTQASDFNAADVIVLVYSHKDKESLAQLEAYSKYEQRDFHNKRKDGVRLILKNRPVSNKSNPLPKKPSDDTLKLEQLN